MEAYGGQGLTRGGAEIEYPTAGHGAGLLSKFREASFNRDSIIQLCTQA